MGAAVAAAGALAGGLAGQKLLGGNPAPPGGGIPGLTSSVGSGKDGTKGSVVQVDPTTALTYFKNASKAQAAGFNKGLEFYTDSLKQAETIVKNGYTDANGTLKQLSYASGQALNQQMRMLGLDPLPQTQGFTDVFKKDIAPTLSKLKGGDVIAKNLTSLMQQADVEQDPTKRAELRQQVQNQFNETANFMDRYAAEAIAGVKKPGIIDKLAPKIDTFRSLIGKESVFGGSTKDYNMEGEKKPASGQIQRDTMDGNGIYITYENLVKKYDKAKAAYDAETATAQGFKDLAESTRAELQGFAQDWSNNYSDQYDKGYTGSQIEEAVAKLPGYEFQLQQGQQALQRTAAAQGLLASANTGIALQTFGQKQAQSFYNSYMNDLQTQVAQGAPATAQISANQINQANALSTLAQASGAAQMDTARQIATFKANQMMQSGILFNDTAKFNATLQFTGQQNDKDREAKQQSNALSTAGMLGSQQMQLGAQQQASQNYGMGYLLTPGQNAYSNAGNWNLVGSGTGAYYQPKL